MFLKNAYDKLNCIFENEQGLIAFSKYKFTFSSSLNFKIGIGLEKSQNVIYIILIAFNLTSKPKQ